jgi:hypothetical protein
MIEKPHALMLAAYLAFIKNVDIPETMEKARAALVERVLRAEASREALTLLIEALKLPDICTHGEEPDYCGSCQFDQEVRVAGAVTYAKKVLQDQ